VFLNGALQEGISLVQLSIVASFEILHIIKMTLLPGHVVVFQLCVGIKIFETSLVMELFQVFHFLLVSFLGGDS
jgi:hypothetical protein